MRFRWSLRWRLVAGAVAAGLAFSAAFGPVATWRVDQLEDQAVSSALLARLDLARGQLLPNGFLDAHRTNPRVSLVQVLGPDGRVRSTSSSLAGIPPLVDVAQVRRAGVGGLRRAVALKNPDVDLEVVGVPLAIRGSAATGALVVGVDAEGFLAAREELLGLLWIGLVVVVLAIGAVAWALAGRALRTVGALTEEAEAISVSDLGRGLVMPQHDAELSRLVAALNRMLARLDASFTRELAMSADASHRLRTPLATLRGEAELALSASDPDEMRRALSQILSDADHLAGLIDRLLTSVGDRTAGTDRPLPDAMAELAERWRRLRPDLAVEPVDDEAARVDLVLLHAVLDPLVENAVEHGERSAVRVLARLSAPNVLEVDVCDLGGGMPPGVAERAFAAWFSTKPATKGGGLGLWLAREAARAAGGDVVLVRSDGSGTVVRAALPVSPTGRSAVL